MAKRTSRSKRNKAMVYIVVAIAGGGLVLSSILAAFLPGNFARGGSAADQSYASYIADLEYRIGQYQDSLEKAPDNVFLLTNLGHAYYDLGQAYSMTQEQERAKEAYAQAIEPYGKALEIEPNDVNVRVNRAVMAFYTDNFEIAQEEFEKAIEIDPSHAKAHYNYAIFLYFGKNDVTAAIERWTTVLDLNPAGEPELVAQARGFIAQAQEDMNQLRGDPSQFNFDNTDTETAENEEENAAEETSGN